MIRGIGIDIVKISRIERMWHKYGDRFLHKMLDHSEFETLRKFSCNQRQLEFLAGRWAAKESVYKALGYQGSPRLRFPDIIVVPPSSVKLAGDANMFANQMGIKNIFLSISHDTDTVVAMAVVEQ